MKAKKRFKTALIIFGAIILCYAVAALLPRSANFKGENPMRKEGELPIFIAHGGGNREFPDNTLEAFYNAYSVDSRVMMETDVSITKDGVLILSHDTTLDRKTDVTGDIADWNYSDLISQRVNFGYTNPTDENDRLCGERVLFSDDEGVHKKPTDVEYPEGIEARDSEIYFATSLEELMLAFPENRINVEIKQSGELGIKALNEALHLLEKHDAFDRVVLASFHEEIYDEFQRLQKAGEVPENFMYSPSYDSVTAFFILQLVKLDAFFPDGMCVFQLPTEQYGLSLSTKGFVNAAHRNNLAVHYWTINETDEMHRLIGIGADGIMSDYPHRLGEVYDSYR